VACLECLCSACDLLRHTNLATRLALFGEDKQDAVWIAKITERGSLPSSFVPPEDIRRLRTHTRYRRTVTQARTAEMQRVEKLLEDALLTEQRDVTAAQKAELPWRCVTNLTGISR
jgi:hypothetical protein